MNKTCLLGLDYHAEVISSISDTSKCKSNIRNFLLHWPLQHFQTWMVMKHGYFHRFYRGYFVTFQHMCIKFCPNCLNTKSCKLVNNLSSWETIFQEVRFKHLCISFIINFYRKYQSSFRENRSGTLGSFLDSTGIFLQFKLMCLSIWRNSWRYLARIYKLYW